MKKYLALIVLTLSLIIISKVPTALAYNAALDECPRFGLNKACITVNDTSGRCVEDDQTGNLYCSAQAVTNGGVNPNYIDRNTTSSGGINISVIKPYGDSIKNIINEVFVPVLMAIAFIVFLWGVFKYFIWNKESESEKMEGRKFAMWGIIGFVIILSVWGLVNILMGALNLQGGKPPPIPKI